MGTTFCKCRLAWGWPEMAERTGKGVARSEVSGREREKVGGGGGG